MNTGSPTERGTVNIANAIKRMPHAIRGHIVAMLGEFIGTLSFIFFAFAGTQTANISSNYNGGTTVVTTTTSKTPQQLLYISLSFGFSLAVNAWVFFRVSGGLFNPAVTLGMVLIGAISILRGILLFIVQMAGAIAGAYIVDALFTGGLNVNTTLSDTTTVAQGVLIEMLLTTLLVFTIFMLAAEKHVGNFIAPVGIGLALFISEMVGVFWTGGSLNPARSFAPAVVTYFHGTQWVYWVGPICGAVLAVIIFKIIKVLEYETANPDPETAAPTGPVSTVDDLNRPASHSEEKDLERGDSEQRYPDTQDTNTFLRNTGSETNGVVKPVYPVDGVSRSPKLNGITSDNLTNGITNPTYVETNQSYRVHDYQQTQYPPTSELQYSAQSSTQDESRWNAIHTANARANTHVIDEPLR